MIRITMIAAAAILAASAAFAADAIKPVTVPRVVTVAPGPQGYIGDRWGIYMDGSTHVLLEKTGAANVPLPGALNFEIEGRGAGLFQHGSSAAEGLGMGHLYWRTANYAFGGFAGFEVFPGNGLVTGGLEGQLYLNNLTLFAQAAEAPAVSGGTSAGWIRGSAQLFTSDNVMFQGDVRYMHAHGNYWLVGGTAEIRAGGTPWAGFASIRYQTVPVGNAATTLLAGFHIHLGNTSLQQAYTTGAVMNTLPLSF